MIVASALILWKGLVFVTHSNSPIVVVLRYGDGGDDDIVTYSGSMEPAFIRGDILFLHSLDILEKPAPLPSPLTYIWNSTEPNLKPGDIVVFTIDGRDIPIVHRLQRIYRKYGDGDDGGDDDTDLTVLLKC